MTRAGRGPEGRSALYSASERLSLYLSNFGQIALNVFSCRPGVSFILHSPELYPRFISSELSLFIHVARTSLCCFLRSNWALKESAGIKHLVYAFYELDILIHFNKLFWYRVYQVILFHIISNSTYFHSSFVTYCFHG